MKRNPTIHDNTEIKTWAGLDSLLLIPGFCFHKPMPQMHLPRDRHCNGAKNSKLDIGALHVCMTRQLSVHPSIHECPASKQHCADHKSMEQQVATLSSLTWNPIEENRLSISEPWKRYQQAETVGYRFLMYDIQKSCFCTTNSGSELKSEV